MKKLLLIALVVASVSTAAAQTSNTAPGASECKLKLSQAPAIRGIHLGMSSSQVLAMFPGAEKDETFRQRWLTQPFFGATSVYVNPSNYESKEKFAGVRGLQLGFLDGELNSFFVSYDGPEWRNSDQFASKVAEALSLPGVEAWQGGAGSYVKTLSCDGFQIQVQITPENGSSTIGVKNLAKNAANIVRERQEVVKDRARQAFKP